MAAAANLKLKGTTWHFRRRVPDRLRQSFRRSEIVLSLRTASAREAGFRARAVYVELERIFRTVADSSYKVEEIEALIEQLRKEKPWDSPTCDRLAENARRGENFPVQKAIQIVTQMNEGLPIQELEYLMKHFRNINQNRSIYLMENISEIQQKLGELIELKHETEKSAIFNLMKAKEDIDEKITNLVSKSAPRAAPSFPPLSRFQQDFLNWKRTQAGWTAHSEAQAAATFRLLVEIIGDKPVRDYRRTDAAQLYDQLLRLPKTHGKGAAKGKAITAVEAIARADEAEKAGKTVLRIQLKTVKRHFSALLQYWKWLKQRGHAEDLIWSGFSFPGTKSSKKKRDAWSEEDLAKLFASDWWGPHADRESAKYWVPLIALHSGMRLEEICRDSVSGRGVN